MNAYDPGKQGNGKGRAIPPRIGTKPAAPKPTMLIGATKILTIPFLVIGLLSIAAYVITFGVVVGQSHATYFLGFFGYP